MKGTRCNHPETELTFWDILCYTESSVLVSPLGHCAFIWGSGLMNLAEEKFMSSSPCPSSTPCPWWLFSWACWTMVGMSQKGRCCLLPAEGALWWASTSQLMLHSGPIPRSLLTPEMKEGSSLLIPRTWKGQWNMNNSVPATWWLKGNGPLLWTTQSKAHPNDIVGLVRFQWVSQ